MGTLAWEAVVLPLNYARADARIGREGGLFNGYHGFQPGIWFASAGIGRDTLALLGIEQKFFHLLQVLEIVREIDPCLLGTCQLTVIAIAGFGPRVHPDATLHLRQLNPYPLFEQEPVKRHQKCMCRAGTGM